jgi:hypothetical protein
MSVPTASVGSAVGFAPMPTGTGWERTPWEALRKADSSGGRMARIIYESREAWERLWGTIERPREREKYPALNLGRGQEYERARPATE